MDSMISLFIDNELSIEEKCLFLEKARDNTSFLSESLQMLRQELLIRSEVVDRLPQADIRMPGKWTDAVRNFFRPAVLIPAFVSCVLLFLLILPADTPTESLNRFVIYRPDVARVEIVGTFTGWERLPLQKIGNSGYWEGTFRLSAGEHRYTYILEGDRPYADPTVLSAEKDDFGGMNSIIHVVDRT